MTTIVGPQSAAPQPSLFPALSREAVAGGKLLEYVSASRLQCWLQCRLKFYFRYVAKITTPPTPPLHLGKVVHAVLQQWNWARWRKEPFSIARFKRVLVRCWNEQQADVNIQWDGEEKKDRRTAWNLLQTYWLETPIKARERPEAVEVRVECELPGLPKLVGIIDLVRAGGVIVDFKTSGKTPDAALAEHQHEIQTSAYALLYRDATGKRESGIELHHLVKTKQPKLVITSVGPMNERQETRLKRVIDSYVSGVERKDYVPSPGFGCASCEYFKQCRKWGGAV